MCYIEVENNINNRFICRGNVVKYYRVERFIQSKMKEQDLGESYGYYNCWPGIHGVSKSTFDKKDGRIY